MKKKIIFSCFLWFSLFVSIICTAQTQKMCGTAGGVRKKPKTDASKTEVSNSLPDSYHFMIKHHVFRTAAGQQSIQQSDLAKIMIDLNTRFDNTNIQFHDCGSPDVINVAQQQDGIVITKGIGANAISIDNTHKSPSVINVYWPFELYQHYSFEPGESVELEGVRIPGHNLFMNSKFITERLAVTLTHELGHYFELDHTFGDYEIGTGPDANGKGTDELVTRNLEEGNCESAGDGLCDTPADPNYYHGCGLNGNLTDRKGKLYVPDAGNYMSYSPYTCQSHFSYEQSKRMLSFAKDYNIELTQYRKEITTALNNVTKTYSASAIIANNTITGTSNVNFKAQTEIKLDPGFKAAKGVAFTAKIAYDCNNLGLPSALFAEEEKATTINEEPATDAHFNVYPNPFDAVFNVFFSLATDAKTTISIQNVVGQEILKLQEEVLKKGDHKNQFDLSEFPNGIYFLVLKNDASVQTKKLLKVN
jgi:hypothetical protein